MDIWKDIQTMAGRIRFANIVYEESKRTLFCHPDDADRIRSWVEQLAAEDQLKVVVSTLVPPGNVYVCDEQALEAGMRETFSRMPPWLR